VNKDEHDMSRITDLQELLTHLHPVLSDEVYVFCTFAAASYGDFSMVKPIASFQEDEGLTLILSERQALKHGYIFEGRFRKITLSVHSDLNAVGLTATVTAALAEANISANIVAAYF
jgi:uncharacterized protein